MNDREPNEPNLDAPEKLRAALARSQSRRVIVPPAVDAAVLRASHEHLAGARTAESASLLQPCEAVSHSPSDGERVGVRGFGELLAGIATLLGGRRFAPLTLAVATIVAAGVLVWLTGQPRAALRPEDLNGDGVVDMLDAFALARELQQGPVARPQSDLNADGTVDVRDVQILATRAVSLETGGRS